MKWTITDSDITKRDPTGVEGFIARMEDELRGEGPPLEGFKFLNSPMEMLRFTREIENEVIRAPDHADLYVGFQMAQKLEGESRRYEKISGAGVKVIGFGTDLPKDKTAELVSQWVSLPYNRNALENQWFLVSSHPTPIAFIGWETSKEMFGKGGLSAPGKQFKGFVSNDQRILDSLITYLERLTLGGLRKRLSIRKLSEEITFPLRRFMAVTDTRNESASNDLRSGAVELAARNSSQLILYDLAAASTLSLVSPYPEENREKWQRVLTSDDLKYLGRTSVAEQIEDIEGNGLESGAILPEETGLDHMARWANKEKVDLIIVPESFENPGLFDRLKGLNLSDLLESTNVPVIVYESADSVRLANAVGESTADADKLVESAAVGN